MGSRGTIYEGDFRKDYSKAGPVWVTCKSPIKKIKDINYIEEKCSLRFTPLIRKRIRSEILSYTIMIYLYLKANAIQEHHSTKSMLAFA